ncbi:MAG: hypothetical protein RL112_2783 [Planctomycetota bacterium]|jgi:cyclic pyranopterin phosphate synthase
MPKDQKARKAGPTGARRSAAREAGAAPSHLRRVAGGSESAMVDTSGKPATLRSATARAVLRFPAGVLPRLLLEGGPKGPVGEVARLAGIAAAKRVDELIPLCHTLPLDHVEVGLEPLDDERLQVVCSARTVARTGVEMEAMVGAATAALAVYDMSKALDKGIVVERVELLAKAGGRSGDWRRGSDAPRKGKERRE